jgi:PKD repeat protein
VTAFSRLKVTHDFHPTTLTSYLYEVDVTIENISTTDVSDLRYTRTMDWDTDPTPFSEYVTIGGVGSVGSALLYADDNGFANPNPLLTRFGTAGNQSDNGPSDHGAHFDYGFGALAAGATQTFKIYYGAAPSEAAAGAALLAVGAQAFSYGQSSGTDDLGNPSQISGAPVTFIFAFSGIGGDVVVPPSTNAAPTSDPGGPYTGVEGSSVAFDGSDSFDTDTGDTLTYDWTFGDTGTGSGEFPSHTYADDGTYNVCLTVTDDASPTASDTECTTATIANVAPTANVGPDQTGVSAVNRNDIVNVAGTWADPALSADNSYAWTWDLDGDASMDASGSASYGSTIAQTTSFADEGFYTLTFDVTDKDTGNDSDDVVIEVLNVPPDCSNAGPSQDLLWPPNHKFVSITVEGVTDVEGDTISINIDSIRQDEPVDSNGDGKFTPDGKGVGSDTAELRAERSGTKKFLVTVACTTSVTQPVMDTAESATARSQ